MKTHISRWGNSLAVRIPRAYAEQAGLSEGSQVEFVAEGEALVLRKPRYRLAALLKQVRADHLHEEQDWGPRTGREAW
jgi:antitoxin MazE